MINPNATPYRISTIFNSFKALYRLSPKQVDDFVKSYEIYDYDWEHGQAKNDTKTKIYSDVKQDIINWYSILNHLCAIGQVEKMYIPPFLDANANIINNQMLFEKKFSKLLDLKKGDNVFELGCGKGRVAAHIASISGANITGINIDQGQLNSATLFAKKNNLSKQCVFVNKDFNDLPFAFEDNTFNSIYEIQALSLSRDLNKLFKELNRILKPGGKISLLEWVRLPKYNENDPHHVELMKQTKPLIGAIGTPTPAEYETALREAGFKILVSEDPSIKNSQDPLITKADRYFVGIYPIIKILVKMRILPKHFTILFERLSQGGSSFIEAVNLGLMTSSYHIVAEKE